MQAKNPALTPTALEVLGEAGGDRAAEELEQTLRRNPNKPGPVARGLFEVASQDALDRAVSVLTDDSLKSATRAAIATHFMARMKEEEAPGDYRQDGALQQALTGLREVLDEGRSPSLTVAAVGAIGKIGDRDADVEPLLALLRNPSAEVAPAVVAALGQLGGEFAASNLVELISTDPQLREPAGEALGSFSNPKDVPVDDLIDLLEHEEREARLAAHTALMGLSGSADPLGYDPYGEELSRRKGIDRWKRWWETRRGR